MRFRWVVLDRRDYESLLRAAKLNLDASAKSNYTFGLNKTAMLLWRLNPKEVPSDHKMIPNPFEYIEAVDGDDGVIVFAVVKGRAFVTTDPEHLFPSDNLVQQLRLLL